MAAPNRNTLWAQILVDELARAGLRAACIAPGSRSTPLTLAFADHPNIAVYSLLDERGASFFALGMALATEVPVALVCTSGTATANFHPAIVEAYYSEIPLLILTGDRPHELRDSGANQTIDQVKMYGDHLRWFVDVAPPEASPPPLSLRYLRTLACRALARTGSPIAGPVHLNFPFRKPLEPTLVHHDVPGQHVQVEAPLAYQGRPANRPFTQITRGVMHPATEQVDSLVAGIQQAPRGLIVCGPRCQTKEFAQAVTRLARLSGYPILADALSGVRFGPHHQVDEGLILSGYETFLQPDIIKDWQRPDLILHFGATPTSKALGDYLGLLPASNRILISKSGVWRDDTHTISTLLCADPTAVARITADKLAGLALPPRDTGWLTNLQRAEDQAHQVFDSVRAESYFEGAILADVVDLMTDDSILFTASSMPVRHLDQFVKPQQTKLLVLANRGASGIEGTISCALGAAKATGQRLVLVIGDVAFYHDLNGLLALKRCNVEATIVLIHNDGGGIFQRLPIAGFDSPFTDLFVTPHGLNFEPAIRMFGAGYERVTHREDFRRAFRLAFTTDTSKVIEVSTDAIHHEKMRRRINKLIGQGLVGQGSAK